MSDDFDEDAVDFEDAPEEGGFEDFSGGGGTTLGEMWRNNPLVKIGVIAGGLITIIGAIVLFGGGNEASLRSQVKSGGDASEAPGSGPVTQIMRAAIEEGSEQRTEKAMREGGSAMPTPIDTSTSRLKLPEEELAVEDPLERWRRIQEERQRQTVQRGPVLEDNPNIESIDSLATAMAAQMEGILESQNPVGPETISITDSSWLDQKRKEAAEKLSEAQAVNGDGQEEIVNILIPAGEVEYAQLVTEANSDTNGPILAKLASGPLAGAKLLGTFETENDFLVLTFDTIVINGIAHSTNAVALNPDTTGIGIMTDIDRRYFKRVILPAAAAFVEGLGGAIAETGSSSTVGVGGSTTVASPKLNTRQELYKGLEVGMSKVSELLDEEANDTEVLIRVESGTPMGLLFIEPVTDETG